MLEALYGTVGMAVGLLAGAALVLLGLAGRLGRARAAALALTSSARDEVDERRRQTASSVANQLEVTRAGLAAARATAQRELDDHEADIAAREAQLDARHGQLEAARQAHTADQARASAREGELVRLEARVTELEAERRQRLEAASGATREDLRDATVEAVLSRAVLEVKERLRQEEIALKELAPLQAQRVMATVMERYNGIGHLERVHNTVTVEDPKSFEALADPAAAAHLRFVELVGCELHADADARSLTVRGDDPLAREVGRRVLRRLIERGPVDAELVRSTSAEVWEGVHREVAGAARRAQEVLGLAELPAEVAHLVGRLQFRLSYSQNQWKHAVEVAYLGAMLASELGLPAADVEAARRGGLLHDIGKAMTHDREGAHAVLGAEVARRCGEDEVVANAIGSHHNDEPPRTPVAYLVTAADAISGARPGARRESATSYLSHLAELVRIAQQSPAVRRVDVMQAGREVRVTVAGPEHGDAVEGGQPPAGPVLADHELPLLAQDIARSIEEQLVFAGQIRVTVIRESRAVAIAR